MRVAALADCHIDHGKNGRWNDKAWAAACAAVREGDFDVCVIAGDMFERGSASGEAMNQACEGLQQITESGTPVVYVLGNHEWIRLPPGQRPSALVCGYVEGVTVVEEPGWIRVGELNLAAVPWAGPEATPQPETLARLRDEWDGDSGPRLAVVHAQVGQVNIKGSFGSEREIAIYPDETASLDDLDDTEVFTRTLLGHVHRRQELSESCAYVGSIDRITFIDEGQPKGFSIVEWDEESQSWKSSLHPTATAEFHTVGAEDDLEALPEGSFVRFQVDDDTDEGMFDRKKARELGLKYCGTVGSRDRDPIRIIGEVEKVLAGGKIDVDFMELLEDWMTARNTPSRLHEEMHQIAETTLGWVSRTSKDEDAADTEEEPDDTDEEVEEAS